MANKSLKELIEKIDKCEALYDLVSEAPNDTKYLEARAQAEEFLNANGKKLDPYRESEGFTVVNAVWSLKRDFVSDLGDKYYDHIKAGISE